MTENLVFYKGRFSRFTYTINRKVDFRCTEETRLYLFHAYELSSFNFVLLVMEKTLVITTNLTNPEFASEVENKKATINLRSNNDKCFLYAVIVALHYQNINTINKKYQVLNLLLINIIAQK